MLAAALTSFLVPSLAVAPSVAAPPVIGAWFWTDDLLDGEAWRPFLDAAAEHSPYTVLTTSLRIGRAEITDPALHDQIKRAVTYARERGLRVAFDLDVRLARRAFQAEYPDELQQELVLRRIALPATGSVDLTVEGQDLGDHMTGGTIPYRLLDTRLVRVYAYRLGARGIEPGSLRELAVEPKLDPPRRLTVTLPAAPGEEACVVVAHTYLTPDVFAPHLLGFQRRIVSQYADVPLGGLCKDEWGHPPDHSGNPAHDHYWYSPAHAAAYARRCPGHDLVRDCLLMAVGEAGRQSARSDAIDAYQALCLERNAAVEADYYACAKSTYGPDALVVTHATWTPYPGAQEMRKQGLDWWHARRDIGQSDETTPWSCRTSLAKRWGFPLWYNQYYSPRPEDYQTELWADALAGGRINFHPLYPRRDLGLGEAHLSLLRLPLMRAVSRLRLLDRITRAPLDCPVAVVFGHRAAMNWTAPTYNQVGVEVCSALARDGYPADLVPSTLADDGALHMDADGWLTLGPQRYRAVVLHGVDHEGQAMDALRGALSAGRTKVFAQTSAAGVADWLRGAGVPTVTPWSRDVPAWGYHGNHAGPPTEGYSRLTDGTWLRVAGSHNAAGDAIRETAEVNGQKVTIDAEGLVALRLSGKEIEAAAAAGLRRLAVGDTVIESAAPVDLAWDMVTGQGWVIGTVERVPAALRRAVRWTALREAPPL